MVVDQRNLGTNCSYCGDEDAAFIKSKTDSSTRIIRLCQNCGQAFTDGQNDPKARLDDVTDDKDEDRGD
jgi:uncharacterized Zn finger protein